MLQLLKETFAQMSLTDYIRKKELTKDWISRLGFCLFLTQSTYSCTVHVIHPNTNRAYNDPLMI